MSLRALQMISDNAQGQALLDGVTVDIIVNKDVALIGEYGQVSERVTTIDVSSDLTVSVGSEFVFTDITYIVDKPKITDDGMIKTFTVVEQ